MNIKKKKARTITDKTRLLKRVVAIMLVVVLLPVSDISNAHMISTLKRIYADNNINNAEATSDTSKDYFDETVPVSNEVMDMQEDENGTESETLQTEDNFLKLWGRIDETACVVLNINTKAEYIQKYQIIRNGEVITEIEGYDKREEKNYANNFKYTDEDTQAGAEYRYEVKAYTDASNYMAANTVVQMPDTLIIDGEDYVLTGKTRVFSLELRSGSLDLAGYGLEVCKNASINGRIKFNKGTLVCNSDINLLENAYIYMNYGLDCLNVSGDFNDSIDNRLQPLKFRAGNIRLEGNVVIGNSADFSDHIDVRLTGTKDQKIKSGSVVRIYNYNSKGNITAIFSSDVGAIINKTDSNNVDVKFIRKETENQETKTVDMKELVLDMDQTIDGNLCVTDGKIDLNGYTLTVAGDMEVAGTQIDFNHGRLIVEGSLKYTIKATDSVITMLYDEDYMQVEGHMDIRSDNEEDHTEAHTEGIRFTNGTVKIEGRMNVYTDIMIENAITAGYLYINKGNIEISGELSTDGCYYDGGMIVMKKGRFINYGSFGREAMMGYPLALSMQHDEDYVCIQGDFLDGGYRIHGYRIHAGTLELKGNNNKVYADGSAKIVLSGIKGQSITGAFHNIEVVNLSADEVSIESDEPYNMIYTDRKVSYEGVELMRGYTLTEDMAVEGDTGLYIGELNLNGYTLTVNGNFYHKAGTVNINGGYLEVLGNYVLPDNYTTCSFVNTTGSDDRISIGGSLITAQDFAMEAGVLEVGGNINKMNERGGVKLGESNILILNGSDEQIINAGYTYNIIDIQNYSTEGVRLTESFQVNEITGNTYNIKYALMDGIVGWRLYRDEVYDGDFRLSYGAIDLNGHTLTINGDYNQEGGILFTNNGRLVVKDDFSISGGSDEDRTILSGSQKSSIIMEGQSSEITVEGKLNVDIYKKSEWQLKEGCINIKGDMNVKGMPDIIHGKDFVLNVSGNSTQTLTSTDLLDLKNINFCNSNHKNITLKNIAVTDGTITGKGGTVNGLYIGRGAVFTDGKFDGSIELMGDYEINGEMHISGAVKIPDKTVLTVNGSLYAGSIEGSYSGRSGINVTGEASLNGMRYMDNINVSGRVDIAGIIRYQSINITGTGQVCVRNSQNISDGIMQVNGAEVCIEESYEVKKGKIILASGSLHAAQLEFMEGSSLCMSGEEAYLSVGGLSYSSDIKTDITAGTIELTGDAYINENFVQEGSNTIILSGDSAQIFRSDGTAEIKSLELKNTSDAGVFISYAIEIDNFIINDCRVIYILDHLVLNEDLIIEGNVYSGDCKTVKLNGYRLEVTGDFISTSAELYMDGGKLVIGGDYYYGPPEWMKEVDIVLRNDNQSYEKDGSIEIMGNMYLCPKNYYGVYPYLNFGSGKVLLYGNMTGKNERACNIYAATICLKSDNAQIKNCELLPENFVTEGREVCTDNDIYISRGMDTGSTEFTGQGILVIEGIGCINNEGEENAVNADIKLIQRNYNDNVMKHDININGSIYINDSTHMDKYILTADNVYISYGTLWVETGRLVCNGNMTIGTGNKEDKSSLIMRNDEAYVVVKGDYTIKSAIQDNGDYMTAGTLDIYGDFIQAYSYYNTNFMPTGTHRTILRRKMRDGKMETQKVSFLYPYESKFNILTLTRRKDSGYSFNTSVSNICEQLVYEYDDSVPPSDISGIKLENCTEDTVTISFTEATDNRELMGYYIYRDGVCIADVDKNTLKYTDKTATADTTFVYTVYAYDDCDNMSTASPELTV